MSCDSYVQQRENTFAEIGKAFGASLLFESPDALLVGGDSLQSLKRIPDHSISLILTDPPYHSTKKKNIRNDTAFADDQAFLSWMEAYMHEWYRVLRPNGSIYVCCSSMMAARIEVLMMKQFNILSHLVWTKPNEPGFDGWQRKMKKESLRQWFDHSERIIFAEPAYAGNLTRTWLGSFLRAQRKKCRISGYRLTAITEAFNKVNHGGSVSNWESGRNTPSREQYEKICRAFLSTGHIDSMPAYENAVRAFEVSGAMGFTDIWNFSSVRPYAGKHPAEKPLDMLEHCINASSYENDIVLDCFAGSGSTALAALNTGRKTISMELEDGWCDTIRGRLEHYYAANKELVKSESANRKGVINVVQDDKWG